MYGGANIPGVLGGGYDDLYVLTIPTFTWVKMFPVGRNGSGDYPHHSLTCNMVPGRAQMIISGGQFPLTQDCDSPTQWGTHNADLGKQNANKGVWDLYKPNKTTYAVPDEVIAVVGGDGHGGATRTAPANGFDHTDVSVLVTLKADVAARKPTRAVDGPSAASDAPRRRLSTGAIVGIAVGAAVLFAALGLGCYILGRKRYRERYHSTASAPGPDRSYHVPSMSEARSPQTAHLSLSPAASPYSPPYGNSPFQPPSPQSPHPQSAHPQSPHGVPAHMGLPAELASGSATPAGLAGTPALTGVSSAGSYPPQQAYFSETATLLNQPQFDAQGNMWVPQVSMVQVAQGVTPPLPAYVPAGTDQKTPQPAVAELHSEPQELSAERDDPAEPSTQHKTYYNN
ncbi:hypothetical protein EsH8_IV_000958 [Colletotrichum jinshuiense]